MLVCSVSLRPQRHTIAADIFEVAGAVDEPSIGAIFATLTDDPGNARDILDAFTGQRMVEAATADVTLDAESTHPAVVLEEISAAVAAQDAGLVSAVTYVTWDAATVAAVTLSGGDLIATNTAKNPANQGARVADANAKATGKYYFEATFITITGGANLGVGIGTTASSYTGIGNNATTGDHGYRTGIIYASGANTGISVGTYSNGQVAGIAVDLDNRKIWFRHSPSGNWNNNASYDPATNTGGVIIPTGTMVPFVTFGGTPGGAANNVVAGNFGASAFSGAVPSGFTAGWPTGLGMPLSISGTPVTTGTEYEHGVGSSYAGFTVTATGGTPPYTYSIASGTLPAGITLNSSSGAVSGTPAFESAGVYSGIVIRATDAGSATANLGSFTLTINFKDPYYSNVNPLLDYDAADGNAVFTNQKTGSNFTVLGNAQHDTGVTPLYGTSSFLFDGSGDYLAAADNALWNLAASNFTIDFTVRPTSVTGTQAWLGQWQAAPNLGWLLNQTGTTVAFNVSTNGTTNFADVVSASGTLVINTWSRWRLDFDGTKYRLYKNGAMVASSTTLRTINNSGLNLGVCATHSGSFTFFGNCRGIRLTLGTARTASDSGYTISNRAFPTS